MDSSGTPRSESLSVFVPREVKPQEHRVALTPAGCAELTEAGVQVTVQRRAGAGSGFSDVDYQEAGALLVDTPAEGFASSRLIVKVKEPLPEEYDLFKSHHILFTFLHLAANRSLTEALIECGLTALAYETLVDEHGSLPLLRPMSEVAGRMSVQEGARHLLRHTGGRGVLLGGVPGTAPGKVCVVGGGVVGTEAARVAAGMGAQVVVLDRHLDRLRQLCDLLPNNVVALFSDRSTLLQELAQADLVIGAVLLRGGRAPHLIRRRDLALMRPGSVIVDVAIDQGGMCETSQVTSHEDPTVVVDGVLHYGVPNIPGAVSRTSTLALCSATLPFIRSLALRGVRGAMAEDSRLLSAVNVIAGHVTEPAVANTFSLPVVQPEAMLTEQ